MALSGTSNPGIINVRDLQIGTGSPKVCVPILGRREVEILSSAQAALGSEPDLVEWRMDWFDAVEDNSRPLHLLRQLRLLLNSIPILVTFRSSKEGGARQLNAKNYVGLLCRIMETGDADLVDAELSAGPQAVAQVITRARDTGVVVVGSSHDFDQTPDEKELLRRMERMAELGCDIAKIAVMPRGPRDVLTLLSATERMHTQYPEFPIVTMSMGQTGLVSRLCGELFGSAITFGTAGQASAPGQVPVHQLRQALALLHNNP